jgi:hypothetical protein
MYILNGGGEVKGKKEEWEWGQSVEITSQNIEVCGCGRNSDSA